MCKYLVSLIIALSVLMSVPIVQAGTLEGVPGVQSKNAGTTGNLVCPDNSGIAVLLDSPSWVANSCTLYVLAENYVPVSGNYSLLLRLYGEYPLNIYWESTETNAVWFDQNKPIGSQGITFSGGTKPFVNPGFQDGTAIFCVYLKGNGGLYKINGLYPLPDRGHCTDGGNLSPTPPQPVISCKVNNANSLDVNLGTLDRAVIPTVPGSGQPQSAQFPVTCTGGAASMKMQLNYMPITVSGSQVVNSSINGLGVAVSYNDKILAPSDITTMQFPEGNTDVTLKFEAVRNPSVEVGDIKTGPFTASAVLVMTQQ